MEMNENVATLHLITYRVLFPVLIVTGALGNSLGIFGLLKIPWSYISVNRYFLALAVSNNLHCLMSIIISVTSAGCDPPSAAAAFIYAHFGWTMISTVEIFSICIITLLSYDRFLAIWFPYYFRSIQREIIFNIRMVVSFLVSLGPNLIYIVHGTSCCVGDIGCNLANYTYSNTTMCKARDGYDSGEASWHFTYTNIRETLVHWIPVCLMVFFNSAAIIGVRRNKKLKARLGKEEKEPERCRDVRLIKLLIAITISFIVCNLPISIHLSRHGKEIGGRCHGDFHFELYRSIGNLLQLLEQSVCFAIYILMNTSISREIKIILHILHPDDIVQTESTEMN